MSNETFLEAQVRLVLEKQCRDIAVDLTKKMPAGVEFCLFMFDYGKKGNLSYMSTADREDAVKLIQEWLDHMKSKE